MALFQVPAAFPFLPVVADALVETFSLTGMAGTVVLVPNRRIATTLEQVLLDVTVKAGRSAVLLPTLVSLTEPVAAAAALGLVPPPAPPSHSHGWLALAALVQQEQNRPWPQALAMAEGLLPLFNELAACSVTPQTLSPDITESLAAHWQQGMAFLPRLYERWLEAQHGAPHALHTERFWAQAVPVHDNPLWLAGLPGQQTPGMVAFVRRLAEHPHHRVLLPDTGSRAVHTVPRHPDAGVQVFVRAMGFTPQEIPACPASSVPDTAMAQLADSLFLPPALLAEDSRPVVSPPAHLRWTAFASEHEEAAGLALAVREALETPGQTVALVTDDRALAQKVTTRLQRWDIQPNDAAGRKLGHTPSGTFLLACCVFLQDNASALEWRTLLYHPFCRLGFPAAVARQAARMLELRGMRPCRGRHGLSHWIQTALSRLPDDATDSAGLDGDTFRQWCQRLLALCQPQKTPAGFAFLCEQHQGIAEAVASDENGVVRCWLEEDGEAARALWAELTASLLPAVQAGHFPAVLERLLNGISVPGHVQAHPRVFLWSFAEALYQQADVVLAGGLHQEAPPPPDNNLWLPAWQRPALGLPDAAESVGTTNRCFRQLLHAPKVLLTWPLSRQGAETTPSSWLLRLRVLLGDATWKTLERTDLARWAARWDVPDTVTPCPEPLPTPPLAARPVQLSVSDMQLWQDNPYGLYARHVLRLRELDPLEEEPGGRERGTLLHQILADFGQRWQGGRHDDARALLDACAHERFAAHDDPLVQVFWRARYNSVRDWFCRQVVQEMHWQIAAVEKEALWQVTAGFTLRSRADRLDTGADGLRILDYKTGRAASKKDIESGRALQLLLEGLMARHGSFGVAGEASPVEVAYWKLEGKPASPATIITPAPARLPALLDKTHTWLETLLAAFSRETQPYRACPAGKENPHCPWKHLMRQQEWEGSA